MKNKYYIEEVRKEDENKLPQIIISCANHSEAIVVNGDYEVATDRAVTIIRALNGELK